MYYVFYSHIFISTDVLQKITNENVRDFLLCHRNDIGNTHRIETLYKKIIFDAVPLRTMNPRAKKRARIDEFAYPSEVPRAIKIAKEIPQARTHAKISSSTLSEHDSYTSASDYEPQVTKRLRRRPNETKAEVVTAEVVSAIDRCGVSSQDAMLVMSVTINAAGQDISDMNLSKSTIDRRRHTHRASIDSNIRDTFESGDSSLTVHYDEKKMRDNTGGVDRRNVTVNRLAIVVSNEAGYQLLGIPKINNGTGDTIAKAVNNALEKWDLSSKVRALCFDTTSANTGWRSGSAFILEKMLKRPVLFFACRHHIAELLLKKAFEITVEKDSSGPNIVIFKRFQNEWPSIIIDPETILMNSAINDTCIQGFFPPHIRDELVQFAYKQLNAHHDRADYADFAHMVLLFLGEKPLNPKGNFRKIKVPGAVSRARFMGPATYDLKMYLFRDQFHLTGAL